MQLCGTAWRRSMCVKSLDPCCKRNDSACGRPLKTMRRSIASYTAIPTRCGSWVCRCRGSGRNAASDPIERVLLVIVEKATGQSIGIGAFQDFDRQRRRVEAGMMLGHGARGRGFGKEGLRALVTYAFATFEVDEVWIQHAADNTDARRVPVSLGLSHDTDAVSSRFTWSAHRQSWPTDLSVSG
jgi:Acetyltransferase (GNAT) domain